MSNSKFSLRREMQKLIKILFQASKWMFPIMIFQNMILSLLPFLNIWYGYRILDAMLAGSPKDAVMDLVRQMILWNLGLGVLAKCLERCRIVLRERVYLEVDETIIDKTLAMEYEMLESKYRANLLRTVQEGQRAGNDICTFCDKLCGVIRDMFSLGYAMILLRSIFTSHPGGGKLSGIAAFCSSSIAPVVLLLLYLLVIVGEAAVLMKQNRIYDEAYQDNLSNNRKMEYFYELIFYEYKNGKDFRLYRMEKLLLTYLRQFFDGIRERTSRFLSDSSKLDASTLAAEGILLFLAYLFVGVRALSGNISVAEVLKYVSTLMLFSQACKSMMNRYGELERILFSLQNYSRYLELGDERTNGILPMDAMNGAEEENGLGEERNQDRAKKAFSGLTLEFKDVSFSYPDSSEKIISHFSLKLDLQGKLALVGKNGAGKSTFIKLLCRLYDPTQGQILINGVDIRSYDREEYMKLFSVVFQDFKLYAFGLGANVAAQEDYDEDKVWGALEAAGIRERAEQFLQGLDTLLYNWLEGGVEISGGEEQKIAIARALYKDAPIVILDEPTSALDPVSEYEIYKKIDLLINDKAAIYISHRMSSCRFCDQILVFEQGRVTQRGSHEELIKEKGLYQELWNAQAQYYNAV